MKCYIFLNPLKINEKQILRRNVYFLYSLLFKNKGTKNNELLK